MEEEILTQAWREEHVASGDDWLETAEDQGRSPGDRKVAALIAQAHYLAANVRAKPASK